MGGLSHDLSASHRGTFGGWPWLDLLSIPRRWEAAMFLTKTSTTIRGKTYTHYKLVESVREAGRVKHRVLCSLGALSEAEAQQIRAVLAVKRLLCP